MKPRDAVVIGAGPNGLVAANLLADAGWQVDVLEAQPRWGGAVASDTDLADGFVHDTFSSFYPLGAASPVLSRLGLEAHGLRWRHAPAVLGHPLPDGDWALLHRDPEQTAAGLEAHQAGDGEAWLALCREWEITGRSLVRALLSPFPPIRAGLGLAARLPRVGGIGYLKTLLEPVSSLVNHRFRSEAARLLVAGNAMHADIGMNAPGSGLFGVLLAMLGQTVGFPVPEGGAGRLADALARRLRAAGGEIRTGVRASRVRIDRLRATGVLSEDGRFWPARAVIADVSAPALYGGLVPFAELPDRVRREMARFEWDPATLKVDWALSAPVPWRGRPAQAPGTVHVADSLDELARSHTLVHDHVVPAKPFLLVGQMTTADPSRSPAGTEALWAYTHLPQEVHHDEGGDGITGRWDDAEIERLADRIQARLEAYAPGFSATVISRRILGPRQLQARNENLHGGALGGGTASLQQQLIFRPIPGSGRPGTPIRGLFLGSSSAHPGGGVHGACGANAARAVLAASATGRL